MKQIILMTVELPLLVHADIHRLRRIKQCSQSILSKPFGKFSNMDIAQYGYCSPLTFYRLCKRDLFEQFSILQGK